MWHVWERGEVHTGFWWGNLRERDHLVDLGVDENKILKCIGEVRWEVMDRTELAQDRDRW